MSGIYTAVELQTYSLEKLYALYRAQQFRLAANSAGSRDYDEAITNLRNITHAINICRTHQFRPRTGPGF